MARIGIGMQSWLLEWPSRQLLIKMSPTCYAQLLQSKQKQDKMKLWSEAQTCPVIVLPDKEPHSPYHHSQTLGDNITLRKVLAMCNTRLPSRLHGLLKSLTHGLTRCWERARQLISISLSCLMNVKMSAFTRKLSICCRWLVNSRPKVHFITILRITANANTITKVLATYLNKKKLDYFKLVSQGYNGAGVFARPEHWRAEENSNPHRTHSVHVCSLCLSQAATC